MLYRLFFITFFLIINSSFSQEKLPRPEVEIDDPLLTEFISDLKTAVIEHEKEFIIKILSPDIMNGFGGSNGIEEFKSYWNWDSGDSSFWNIMDKLLEMGGGAYQNNGQYTLPYVSFNWPDKHDAYVHAAITGTKVNVRDQPNLSGSIVLGQFSYDIIKIDYERSFPDFEDPEWYYVESLNGKLRGYVYGDYVWSPIGYRAFFEIIDGEWKMTILLEGD